MGVHFQYEMIPAGNWSRLTGTTPRGGDAEARPHLVPTTQHGRTLVNIDMTGFMGRTGLCPGQITRQDGSTEYAYRFIELTEEDCVSLIDQLDEMIHEHMVQSL